MLLVRDDDEKGIGGFGVLVYDIGLGAGVCL